MKQVWILLAAVIFTGGGLVAQDSTQNAINDAAVSLPEGFPGLEPMRVPAHPASPPHLPPAPEISANPAPSLPGGGLVWSETTLTVPAATGQDVVRFHYTFTNLNDEDIIITRVHPSCGCTTAEMPATPWVIPPGTNGTISLRVNLAGKSGALVKTTGVATDKGQQVLTMKINIAAPEAAASTMTESARARAMSIAKADRQAVFKGDCAACHNKDLAQKSGKALFAAACAICHEAEHRASMVPDLKSPKKAAGKDFWHAWIANGKPDSLMPAFAQSQEGPLTDEQIEDLATWLAAEYPRWLTNAPATSTGH